MSFGKILRAARIAAGLSATDFAEQLGCSRVQVHRIESSASVTEATVRRYCEALGVTPELTLLKT